MAIVRGRYISLAKSSQRRSRLERHLQDLGVADRYVWFSAVRGDAQTADLRGLSAGEWGLWQSWLDLLQEEQSQPEKTYDWLHIVEDDAELSRQFLVFCQQLKPGLPSFELLFTDMYVNPSIYRSLAPQHQILQSHGEVQFRTDLYSGCTASVLIHRNCIPAVLHNLTISAKSKGPLLPRDNQFRQLIHQRQLRFARTAPFLSCVQNESFAASTIQEREQEDCSVVLTQQICSILRRQLSVLDNNNTTTELIHLMHELAQDHGYPNPGQLTQAITLELMNVANAQNLLRYSLQPRLKGQPDNPQQT